MNKNSVVIKDNKVTKNKSDRLLELYDYLNNLSLLISISKESKISTRKQTKQKVNE
jgi:hypothetical protein